MATPDGSVDDIFLPGGRLRLDCLTDEALRAVRESLRLARETRWDSVRSPHVFMGLLAVPDASVCDWGERLQADLPSLLGQFQELFHQEEGEEEAVAGPEPRVPLRQRHPPAARRPRRAASDHRRAQVTPMDLLISLLTASNSIVAECFERIGVTAAKLTELAVIAEHNGREQRVAAKSEEVATRSAKVAALRADFSSIQAALVFKRTIQHSHRLRNR